MTLILQLYKFDTLSSYGSVRRIIKHIFFKKGNINQPKEFIKVLPIYSVMGAQEYLLTKGFKKIHQPKKRYNLSIGELVSLLEEFASQQKDYRLPDTLDLKQLKLWM